MIFFIGSFFVFCGRVRFRRETAPPRYFWEINNSRYPALTVTLAQPGGRVLRAAGHGPAYEVHGHLLAGAAGEADARTEARANARRSLLGGRALLRVRNVESFAAVQVVGLERYGDDLASVLDTPDFDAQPLSVDGGHAVNDRSGPDRPAPDTYRLFEAQAYAVAAREGLVLVHAGADRTVLLIL